MADANEDDILFPFGDLEVDEVDDVRRVGYVRTSDDADLLPFGDIADEEIRDLRRLELNSPSQVLQELPFAHWSRNLVGLTNRAKIKAARDDFTYENNIYTPEANTTCKSFCILSGIILTRLFPVECRQFYQSIFYDCSTSEEYAPQRGYPFHYKVAFGPLSRGMFCSSIVVAFLTLSKVFKHVHPLDLYNISIADPSLKSIVTPLWKNVWEGIPDKPLTVSYTQWADLWFGPAICDVRCFNVNLQRITVYCRFFSDV